MPGVVAVLTGADTAGHRPVLGPRHQGPAIAGHRPGALRGRAGRRCGRRRRGDRQAAVAAISVEYAALPVVGTLEEALAPDAPLVHEGDLRPGLFHGLGTLRRATATSAIATASSGARCRGSSRGRTSWSRASTCSRASTSTRWRPIAWSPSGSMAGSRCGRRASTPSWCAPRSRRCSTCPSAGCGSSSRTWAVASAASRTRRWSPSRWRSRARRVVRCASSTGRRVDGHDPAPWCADRDAHGRHRGRCLAGPEVTLTLDTGAYADNGPA